MKYGARAAGYAGWRRPVFWLLCVAVALPVQARNATEDVAGVPAGGASADIISAIEFSGNRVTNPKILRYEILVKEGDIADPALIERSRQAIMDLGLFVSVDASVERRDDGTVLRF
ncbi:MAG TPA: POTRA domain-containing protein, partial [Acidiferrobacterales bacterium]|nr:POTRA domain-containing protein [Acidiferrobacterales bacterium]